MRKPIPVFVINLKNRIDRKQHITKEFSSKNEFTIKIIRPIKHKISAVSLWHTLQFILNENINKEYIIFCEDDHQFTVSYTQKFLFDCISEARKLKAEVLCGGVSWFEDAVRLSENLIWVKKFSGLQFTIFFKPIFAKIIKSDFEEHDAADFKISSLSKKNFLIYPFISTQKEFGYSDVTAKNNGTERVEELFLKSSESVEILKKISKFYTSIKSGKIEDVEFNGFDTMTISTYIIYNEKFNLSRIKQEFKNRKEFDLTFVELKKHRTTSVALWLTVKKIIESSLNNEDDVIIICNSDHRFTNNYSKEFLLKNILEAYQQGAKILLGGINEAFELASLIAESRFWIKSFSKSNFFILYKSVFKKIIEEPFDGRLDVDKILSEITSHKMVIFPFISTQGKTTTTMNNAIRDNIYKRLSFLQNAYKKYSCKQ